MQINIFLQFRSKICHFRAKFVFFWPKFGQKKSIERYRNFSFRTSLILPSKCFERPGIFEQSVCNHMAKTLIFSLMVTYTNLTDSLLTRWLTNLFSFNFSFNSTILLHIHIYLDSLLTRIENTSVSCTSSL